jgi:hypothetical protein
MFHRVCRRLAEGIAEAAGVNIDTGVYDRVRAFRAPNSRHRKTGLFKRRLSLDELQGMSLDAIRKSAEKPAPFDLPTPPALSERAQADWREAAEIVRQASEAKVKQSANSRGPTLNRQTIRFIRDGAGEGDRHRLLYSAARNLAEFACSSALAHALLTEPALDCGLAPRDVQRQIERGLSDQSPIAVEQAPPPSPSPDLSSQLVALWQGPTPTAEPSPYQPGDAVEHAQDRLGVVDHAAFDFPFGANTDGPYTREGGRR